MTTKDLIQLAVTIIGMVAGPFIAVQLSLKQFRSQKWWERQEQTYTQLLTSLSFIKFCLTQEYHKETNFASYYPLSEDDTNRLKQSRHNLQEIRMSGGYIISEKAAEVVNEFLETYDSDWDDHVQNLENSIDAVDKSIKVLKGEAIGALNPASSNFFQQLKAAWTDEIEPPARTNGDRL